jgi:hypothetical protein
LLNDRVRWDYPDAGQRIHFIMRTPKGTPRNGSAITLVVEFDIGLSPPQLMRDFWSICHRLGGSGIR